MNGLTAEDCEYYLETAFKELGSTAAGGGEGSSSSSSHTPYSVDHMDFLSIIRDIPLLKLSEKDAVTIYAAAEHVDAGDRVLWKSCVSWCYETAHMLLKERFVQRRMALLAASVENNNIAIAEAASVAAAISSSSTNHDTNQTSNNNNNNNSSSKGNVLSIAEEEALTSLKSLAEKLVDFVKVRMEHNIVRVYLPSDKDAYHGTSTANNNDNNDGSYSNNDDDGDNPYEGHSNVLIDIPVFRMPVIARGAGKRAAHAAAISEQRFNDTNSGNGSTNGITSGGNGTTGTINFNGTNNSNINNNSNSNILHAANAADTGGGIFGAIESSTSSTTLINTGTTPFIPATASSSSNGGVGMLTRRNTIIATSSSSSLSTVSRIPSELIGHLVITAIDRYNSVDKELAITLHVSENASPSGVAVNCALLHNLKLPSMCMVDRENALEFAANLAHKLVVEIFNPMSTTHNLVVKT